jgi:hypothetical protein
MKKYRSVCLLCLFIFFPALFMMASDSPAAEFTLAWDPNSNDYSNLIGYNLYYKEGSSIQNDLEGAVMIYIPLTETGFDPSQPSYAVTGLQDNVRYYFTVTAMYEDEESGMSNEVSAINDISDPSDSNLNSNSNSPSGGSSGAGCFITALN